MDAITHFELPVKDRTQAKKFYGDVFGWKFNDFPEMNYTIVHTAEVDEKQMPTRPGAVNGGLVSVEDNGGLNPVLVVDVPNIDEVLEKIEHAGGKISVQKMEVGDMGYYAKFTDPSGVTMGVWQTRDKQ